MFMMHRILFLLAVIIVGTAADADADAYAYADADPSLFGDSNMDLRSMMMLKGAQSQQNNPPKVDDATPPSGISEDTTTTTTTKGQQIFTTELVKEEAAPTVEEARETNQEETTIAKREETTIAKQEETTVANQEVAETTVVPLKQSSDSNSPDQSQNPSQEQESSTPQSETVNEITTAWARRQIFEKRLKKAQMAQNESKTTENYIIRRVAEIEAELFNVEFNQKVQQDDVKNASANAAMAIAGGAVKAGRMAEAIQQQQKTTASVPEYDFGSDASVEEPESEILKEEKEEKEKMKTIKVGDQCTTAKNHLCEFFPRVTCQRTMVFGGIFNYLCTCNYLHTQVNDSSGNLGCVANVFTPCSDLTGATFPCGDNMACQNDSLGIDGFKYCRCLKGFVPMENKDSIPAFCVPRNGTELENEAQDYYADSSQLSPLPILLFALFVASSHSLRRPNARASVLN